MSRHDAAIALRLVLATIDENEQAYESALAEVAACHACTLRIVEELVDIAAGGWQEESSTLERHLADTLDAIEAGEL